MKAGILVCAAAVLASAAVGATSKKDKPEAQTQAAPIKELARCKTISDNTQRLACYDQAAAALLAAEEKADIVVVDREEVENTRRSLFGFNLPDISLFRRHGAKVEQLEKLDGVIASAGADASSQWTFRLQDGSVWHQIDTNELNRPPHPGDAVVIRRAAFGSFMLSVNKAPGVRVRRVS